ncbi:MAG: cytochrome c peroxidase [Flavobacteriales bacterium]
MAVVVFAFGCKKDEETEQVVPTTGPTPYTLVIPQGLPPMQIPADNPLTVEGIALVKSCFTIRYFQVIIRSHVRAATSHIADSLIYYRILWELTAFQEEEILCLLSTWDGSLDSFWDGGAADIESQVLGPIQNPLELHETLENVVSKLSEHSEYPALFKAAFETDEISIVHVMRAIAQFERTMVSGNSRYDQYVRGEASLTPLELQGLDLYSDMMKGDCNHCHVLGSTFSDFEYRNTGLDSLSPDLGRYYITLLESDMGKFKTPSLRNIAATPPYMHDGRFWTLKECVEHYNTGFHYAANLDGNLAMAQKGRMTDQEMDAIVAFLLTLNDDEFLNNPAFRPE